MEDAAEAAFASTAQGRIIEVNRTACDELGYSREELLALRPWDLVEEFTAAGFAALVEQVAARGPYTMTVSHRRKDGSTYPAEGRACVVELGGERVLFALTRDVTERRRAEAALRESEEKFRKIFNHSLDAGFLVDASRGAILDVNPSACRMLGYTRDELLALHVSAVHPDEMPKLAAFTRDVLQVGFGWTDELTCLTKGGTQLPTEFSAAAVVIEGQPRIIAWVRDVSARRRAEAELRESEERFRLVVDNAADALYVVEKDGRIVDVNQRACEVTGYARSELLGMPIWDVATTLDADRFTEHVGRMAAGPITVNGAHRRKDGATFPVEVRACLFQAQGHERVLGLARDVTERVRAEAERRRLEERFACIVESAMDAIVAIDADFGIRLFNAAAEKVFRCPAAQAVGSSMERFLTPRFRELLAGRAADAHGGALRPPLWIAEALTARRADGEEFPVEATISEVEVAGETLRAIILRDVNERRRTEAELRRLQLEKLYLLEEIESEHGAEEIVGTSPAIRRVLRQVEQVADTDSTVLITGETGTGKERIARAVHDRSRRRDRVFVKVNCAALPAGLIESELFGHEKGAFTGAISRRIGRFELADGGTIFLDEIGDLPLELQAKLLHVLQSGEFERVGSTRTIRVNVRVIAATNRDLDQAVANGRFRADLYYRLKVFPIHVPPLRERREDIPLLVKYFARVCGAKLAKRIETVAPETVAALQRYPWPGNVRELENVIERAVIISRGAELELGDWPAPAAATAPPGGVPTLDDVQREHVREVLRLTGWRVSGPKGAARILGLKPTTLAARMKKLGIQRER